MNNLSKIFFVGATLLLSNLHADYGINIQQSPNATTPGGYRQSNPNAPFYNNPNDTMYNSPNAAPYYNNPNDTMYNNPNAAPYYNNPNDTMYNNPNSSMYNQGQTRNPNGMYNNPSYNLNPSTNTTSGRPLGDMTSGTLYNRDTVYSKDSANVDDRISSEIKKALENDKSLSYKAKNIDIAVKNGKVTLSGDVNNELEKNKIEEIVNNVTGVTYVYNKLIVKHK